MKGLLRFYAKGRGVFSVAAAFLAAAMLTGFFCNTSVRASEAGVPPEALNSDTKRVLFISSYAASFISLPDQTQGLSNIFEAADIDMDVEYMDLRRMNTDGSAANFHDYISFKLAHLAPYDAIVTGDDDALQFAMDYRDDLFQDIPVVFMCINDRERVLKAVDMGFTGVAEEHSIAETISIARVMIPGARNVVCIYDSTTTGLGDRDNFFETEDQFPDLYFSGINTTEYTFSEVGQKVAAMGSDTILIYECMFLDKTGTVISIEEAVQILSEAAKIPIFRGSLGGVGEGVIGGRMFSFVMQGEETAKKVVSILAGTDPADIPVSRDSTYQYIFDLKILEKFNISPSLLPEGAVVINTESDFFSENKELLTALVSVAALSAIIILIVVRDNRALRRVKKELIGSKEKLYDFAYQDALTGLPNRSHFYKYMNDLFNMRGHFDPENAASPDVQIKEIALIYVDIDDFKLINDARGHRSGDLLLQHMALGIQNLTEESQDYYAARIGGDEFVIVIINPLSLNETEDMSRRINQIFNAKYSIEDTNFYPSASIGIALYPHDTMEISELVKNADMAMYQSKTEGKNRYTFYDPSMHKSMENTMQIQNKIPEALEQGLFYLVYQPQADIFTNQIIGYEALIRWKDPELGFVSPGSFKPIAEKSGQILPIGSWVLETACRFALRLNQDRAAPLTVSVNISAIQLMQVDFYETVVSITGRMNVPPSWIGLEITETSLISGLQPKADVLLRLRELGFHIILDDFGTGYSSLHYLRELPIETMKIDQTFTNKLGETADNDDLMCLIIEVAHLLKISVVAEGVETKEQLAFLSVNKCDSIQGYYFSYPLPEEEILRTAVSHELN